MIVLEIAPFPDEDTLVVSWLKEDGKSSQS